jgi:hypothetical protein
MRSEGEGGIFQERRLAAAKDIEENIQKYPNDINKVVVSNSSLVTYMVMASKMVVDQSV